MTRWIEAARPRTLTAAVSPVIVGTAAAQRVVGWRFAAALVVGLSLQVAVNFANDLFDARSGVDSQERVGPRRMVSAGLITPRAMKAGIVVAFATAALCGTLLALAVGPELFVIGALAILAALGYSGGPRPYASHGLGEVFVFVFFGLVATAGSTYVQIERIPREAIASAVAVGSLAVAILVVNNMRDIQSDAAAGKNTLAVRLGEDGTRTLYRAMVTLPFALVLVVGALVASPWPALALLAVPLAVRAFKKIEERGAALGPLLGATAVLQLVFAALLAAGLWIS